MMSVYVKIHRWVDGVLKTINKDFNSFEHALKDLLDIDCDHAKIYDCQGRCIHEHKPHPGHSDTNYGGHNDGHGKGHGHGHGSRGNKKHK